MFIRSNSNSSSREGITNINVSGGISINNQKFIKNKTKRKKFTANIHYDNTGSNISSLTVNTLNGTSKLNKQQSQNNSNTATNNIGKAIKVGTSNSR